MKIIIRADSSTLIGSGHVMRCLTLANLLRDKGADVSFICRNHEGHMCDFIIEKGFDCYQLSVNLENNLDNGASDYLSWLGTTQEEDAIQSSKILKKTGMCDWLIIDHYALDIKWEKILRPYTKNIMVIDDFLDRKHSCDLLLNQNILEKNIENEDQLIISDCVKLFGPRYSLLRPEFRDVQKKLRCRKGEIKRILISFGGVDASDQTGKAIDAVLKLNKPDLEIDIVLGPGNINYDKIKNINEGIT